jgi:hypothetical protein
MSDLTDRDAFVAWKHSQTNLAWWMVGAQLARLATVNEEDNENNQQDGAPGQQTCDRLFLWVTPSEGLLSFPSEGLLSFRIVNLALMKRDL